MSEDVIVVGGGLAGLTAGLRLHQAGIPVRVLEAGDRAGGVIATAHDDGYVHEYAANAFLASPHDGAAALCDELGVATIAAAKAARRRWIFIDGALRAVPGGPIDLLRSDLLTWRGKLDLLREPLRPPRDVDRDGDESVQAFAARRFGPEVARSLVAPFVTGVLAADAHDVSLAAGFPRLAALDRDGGVVRGMVRRLRRGERGRGRGLRAPRGGVGEMIDALARALGSRLVVGRAVRSIAPASGGGIDVAVDGSGDPIRTPAAVIATPATTTALLVAAALPDMARRCRELVRSPIAIAFLGFDAGAVRDASALFDGFGVLVAHGEAPRVLGAVFESTVWPGRAPDGRVLVRCIYGGARDPDAVELDDDALIAQARADLDAVLGVRAAPVHRRVHRVRDGIARYPVGHRDRVATLDSLAGQHRLVLAGADYHGVSVNDVIADAGRVVREVQAWR
jgi:oxygen-dependent protoporphyrinogen oxidase